MFVADVRQAEISTILEAGDSSVDIFSVNDEMISELISQDEFCEKIEEMQKGLSGNK